MSRLDDAIQLAVTAHAGQIDEDGFPHIVHALEVMFRAKEWGEADIQMGRSLPYSLDDLMVAAVLHDTVEDTFVTLDLIRVQFGKDVADMVDGVTRRGLGKDETKEFYRDFIYRTKTNLGSHIIKLCDLQHNLSRAANIKKASWRNKLAFKYAVAETILNDEGEPLMTWEQASAVVQRDDEGNALHYFIADPNGKKIEVTEEEFKTLTERK
jgi:GTP diphosphokinase / guanosine-3',5'-bis(diphosphate) 3'-diphosphatase